MFQTNSILSDLEAMPIPIGTRAYVGQRAKNAYYDYVMEKFRHSGISQADLARRIGKGPGQVNRMLANPGNWTIETAAELLAGICAEELVPHSIPFANRAKRNISQVDHIHPDKSPHSTPPPFPLGSVTQSGAFVIDVRKLEVVQ